MVVQQSAVLIGRVLLAVLFVLAGFDKLGSYAETQAYMAAFGVSGALLPLVILAELGGGLALAFGLLTRFSAGALALFTLAAAVLFHGQFGDPMQQLLFMKNLAIAGGLLMVAAQGAGAYSVDAARARRT